MMLGSTMYVCSSVVPPVMLTGMVLLLMTGVISALYLAASSGFVNTGTTYKLFIESPNSLVGE